MIFTRNIAKKPVECFIPCFFNISLHNYFCKDIYLASSVAMTDFTPKININIKSMVGTVLFIAILLILMMKI
jgi:hypothetical protein